MGKKEWKQVKPYMMEPVEAKSRLQSRGESEKVITLMRQSRISSKLESSIL